MEQKADACMTSASWQRGFPAQADVANAERALQEMRGLLSTMQQETAAALEEKKKQDEEEERKKQNELLKKEQMKAQVPAPAQHSAGKQQNEGWFGCFGFFLFLLLLTHSFRLNTALESYRCDDAASCSL